MKHRLLLASYSVPGSGGAATAGYRLFQMLRREGVDAAYVNLIDQQDAGYLRYTFGESLGNPRGLDDVHNCFLDHPLFHPEPRHDVVVSTMRELAPDLVLGIDFIGALLSKHAAPEIPMVYLTAGCSQLLELISRGRVRDGISFSRYMNGGLPVRPHGTELETVQRADLVLTHSDLNLDLYRFFFPEARGKIHPQVISYVDWIRDEALEYQELARPFDERDIDVLFVANRWERPEKNWRLVRKIVRGLGACRTHVVGECEAALPGARHHGFVDDRERLFSLLGRARVVVCASSLDAAPGILFEGSVLGANLVASRNCGNWRICNDSLLVERYRAADFVRAIGRAVERKLPDDIDLFLAARSYQNLLQTISLV